MQQLQLEFKNTPAGVSLACRSVSPMLNRDESLSAQGGNTSNRAEPCCAYETGL